MHAGTLLLLIAFVFLTGCKGIQTKGERAARENLKAMRESYRPQNERPVLPQLSSDSPLTNFLRFALLNNPQVEASYYEWAAAVERITRERSLPDPRVGFQMDVDNMVSSVMPGLMQDVPWLGKLRVSADMASAESRAMYFAFESALLRAAYDVKRPYYQLYFLNDRIRINRETLSLVTELEEIARAQNASGRVTLQDVLRAQIEQERLRIEIVNLDDSRNSLVAQFKAGLGLRADQPNPPLPSKFESTPLDLTSDQIFTAALARNPRLKQMEAEVRAAEAGIRLAHKSKLPDFNAGIEIDARTSPVMARPTLGATLPIWRDKIAAEIAAAQARKGARQARLTAEQIQLAVEFADKSFMYREATRNLTLLNEILLPKARQSLDVARAGYSSGKVDFINLLDAERSFLEFQLAEVDARTRRELVLAELSLLVIGIQPPGAPILGNAVNLEPTNTPAK